MSMLKRLVLISRRERVKIWVKEKVHSLKNEMHVAWMTIKAYYFLRKYIYPELKEQIKNNPEKSSFRVRVVCIKLTNRVLIEKCNFERIERIEPDVVERARAISGKCLGSEASYLKKGQNEFEYEFRVSITKKEE